MNVLIETKLFTEGPKDFFRTIEGATQSAADSEVEFPQRLAGKHGIEGDKLQYGERSLIEFF